MLAYSPAQKAHRHMADRGHVLRPGAGSQAAEILGERHVQHTMQADRSRHSFFKPFDAPTRVFDPASAQAPCHQSIAMGIIQSNQRCVTHTKACLTGLGETRMRVAPILVAFCMSSACAHARTAPAQPLAPVRLSSDTGGCRSPSRLLLHAAYHPASATHGAGCAAPLSTDTLMKPHHWART